MVSFDVRGSFSQFYDSEGWAQLREIERKSDFKQEAGPLDEEALIRQWSEFMLSRVCVLCGFLFLRPIGALCVGGATLSLLLLDSLFFHRIFAAVSFCCACRDFLRVAVPTSVLMSRSSVSQATR